MRTFVIYITVDIIHNDYILRSMYLCTQNVREFVYKTFTLYFVVAFEFPMSLDILLCILHSCVIHL